MVKIIKYILVVLLAFVLITKEQVTVGEGAVTIGGSPVNNNNNNNGASTGSTGVTTGSTGTTGTGTGGAVTGTGATGTGVGGAGTGGAGTGATGTGTGAGGAGSAGTGMGAGSLGTGGAGASSTTKGISAATTSLGATKSTPTTTMTKQTETTKTKATESSKSKKKEGGSFFTSKLFLIMLVIFVIIVAVLGYFYYVGIKDEKEEQMRNLESGNNNNNNNYGGTQTIEINKNVGVSSYNETTANPFADSNKVDDAEQYGNVYNTNYDSPAVDYQNPSLMAAPAPSNPFDSPNLDAMEGDKNMKEMGNGFPDSLPQPSVVKLTEIEKPQQGNTVPTLRKNNEEDDILKPSMVRMTNIETPVPSNTIPTDKDISIGDDILKPSMVKLTEIQTPKESSFNDTEKEKENEEEPKKAVVNMIDLKTPSSNEALNASNLLTPSIMITSTDGKTEAATTGATEQEDVPEEYSEMPEPRPFRAIHAYEPQIDDELRLDVDNEIDVLYEYDDGWCWAINKTTGEQGACPMLCLISIKEEATGEREWEKEMDIMKVPGRRESMLSNSFDTSRLSLLKSK